MYKLIGTEQELTSVYIRSDRAVFLSDKAHIVLKVSIDRKLLEKEYEFLIKAKQTCVSRLLEEWKNKVHYYKFTY